MDAVLVAGARTTGLMMASELARRGVPVRVVDASPGIDPHVRANLIHSRSLEIFQGLGLSSAMLQGSFPEMGLQFYSGEKLVLDAPHAPADSPFPYGQSQSQAHVERVLEKHLAGFGVQVERGVQLVSLDHSEDGVLATLCTDRGEESTMRASWLIGCDGAHSKVRQLIDSDFPGTGDPYPYMLADVRMEGDLQDSRGHIFFNDAGELFVFSTLPGGRRLVCADLPRGSEVSGAPTLEALQQVVTARGLPGMRVSDPDWLAYFHIGYHLAAHFRQGRVFLAGDAAHIHSLLAGQGMNVGIQDAYNLAWKLAMVIGGQAPDAWLDTYELERRPVGEAVVNMTREITENTESFPGLSDADRKKLLQHMIVPESQRASAAKSLQQLDIVYPASELCLDTGDEICAGPPAGAQAPDASPLILDDQALSLYQLPASKGFRLMLFNGAGKTALEEDVLAAAGEAVAQHAAWLEVFVITPPGVAGSDSMPAGATLLRDPEAVMHKRYGAADGALYLLRPDGHVAFRSNRLHALDEYVAHAFGDANA